MRVFRIGCVALTCVTLSAQAPIWSNIENATLLVTGKVAAIQYDPNHLAAPNTGAVEAIAEIEVARVFPEAPDSPKSGDRVRMSYRTVRPANAGKGDGRPVQIFVVNKSYVFPMRPDKGATAPWKLLEGSRTVIPARSEPDPNMPAAPNRRAYLIAEFAYALADGSSVERFDTASYLCRTPNGLTPQIFPALEARASGSTERWIAIATALLSASLPGRPSVSELRTKPLPQDLAAGTLGLLQAVLRKLPPTPETDRQIIELLLANASPSTLGNSAAWTDYADSPVLIETVRKQLNGDVPNSSWIASALIRYGQTAFLKEALDHALRVADRPPGERMDLAASLSLLRDYGSDDQRKKVAALVQKYEPIDPEYAKLLWNFATGSQTMRDVPVLAVVIPDERFGDSRILALCNLEQATKEDLGCNARTEEDRRLAIRQATAWLESHGYTQK